MPLILGSKSEVRGLGDLVHKKYRNIKEYQKADEVRSLQAWLEKQSHLPKLTDDQITLFLHSCYYSIEKAKVTIDNYYTFRTHGPEIFSDRNPKRFFNTEFKAAYFVPLPEDCKTYGGNILTLLKIRDPDTSLMTFAEAVKANFVMMDIIIGRNPFCDGFEVIMDMKGLALGHVTLINFSILKKFMMYVQDAMPIRLKGIHVINTFPLINQIMALVKPLMKQELFSLLHFYTPSDFDIFCKKIMSQDNLPSDYGGKLDSLEKLHGEFCKSAMQATDWLEEIENYKVDESKRMGRSKYGEIYGMQGSFKRLELD